MQEQNPFDPILDSKQLPNRGNLILLFGILGFFTFGILGALAWLWGSKDLGMMNVGLMDAKGIDKSVYGRILGIISLVAWVIAILIFILIKAMPMENAA